MAGEQPERFLAGTGRGYSVLAESARQLSPLDVVVFDYQNLLFWHKQPSLQMAVARRPMDMRAAPPVNRFRRRWIVGWRVSADYGKLYQTLARKAKLNGLLGVIRKYDQKGRTVSGFGTLRSENAGPARR